MAVEDDAAAPHANQPSPQQRRHRQVVDADHHDAVASTSEGIGQQPARLVIEAREGFVEDDGVGVVVDQRTGDVDSLALSSRQRRQTASKQPGHAEFGRDGDDAGADGVYVVDSRGNSTPLATRGFIRRVREAVGESCDVYVQHHNDLGVATANAMAAVEGGANWIDASVIGIGDRGGCVALEEAAALFEMYGIQTGIKLDALYELCTYVQKAYGIQLPPWKPIVGANWNKEEGAGHHEGSADAESTIGIAPRVIGREFENVIGGKILFGRERSSAHTDDPVFLRDIVRDLGLEVSEEQFQRILLRSRAAVASNYDTHYLTFAEFEAICRGVVLAGRE